MQHKTQLNFYLTCLIHKTYTQNNNTQSLSPIIPYSCQPELAWINIPINSTTETLADTRHHYKKLHE